MESSPIITEESKQEPKTEFSSVFEGYSLCQVFSDALKKITAFLRTLYTPSSLFCNYNAPSSGPIYNKVSQVEPKIERESSSLLRKINHAYKNLKQDIQQSKAADKETAYDIFFKAISELDTVMKRAPLTLDEFSGFQGKSLTNNKETIRHVGDLVKTLRYQVRNQHRWQQINPHQDEQAFFQFLDDQARQLVRECEFQQAAIAREN